MMLYLNLDGPRRKQAVAVIIILACVSALWAAFQLTGSARGPLYIYNITNNDSAVGLFANRNHQAVLLAAAIVMLGWYAATHTATARPASLKFQTGSSAIFLRVPLAFVTRSRSGLLLMAPALVAAIILVYYGRYTVESQPAAKSHSSSKRHRGKIQFNSRQIILYSSIALVVILAGLSVYLSRSL